MRNQREGDLFLQVNTNKIMEYTQHTFPKELIEKCKKLIKKRSGLDITDDKAELYLDKCARLMMVAVKVYEQEQEKKKRKKAKSSVAPAKP